MATGFLKSIFQNPKREAERLKAEEQREKRMEELKREREDAFVQHHLKNLFERIFYEKGGSRYSGIIKLDTKMLYPPYGLKRPTYESGLQFKAPESIYHPDEARLKAAISLLENSVDGLTVDKFYLQERCEFGNRGAVSFVTHRDYDYNIAVSLTEECVSHILDRYSNEGIVSDPREADSFLKEAADFSTHIKNNRMDVISKLVAFLLEGNECLRDVNKETNLLYLNLFEYTVHTSGITVNFGDSRKEFFKDYEQDARKLLFRDYGLTNLDITKQYGLSMCLASEIKNQIIMPTYIKKETIEPLQHLVNDIKHYHVRVSLIRYDKGDYVTKPHVRGIVGLAQNNPNSPPKSVLEEW